MSAEDKYLKWVTGMDEFQSVAATQRLRDPRTIDFMTIKLVEEAGEVAGVVKRTSRMLMGQPLIGKRSFTAKGRDKLYDEMSDVLHSLAQLCEVSGTTLCALANHALDKQAKK